MQNFIRIGPLKPFLLIPPPQNKVGARRWGEAVGKNFFRSPKGITKPGMYAKFHQDRTIGTIFGNFHPPGGGAFRWGEAVGKNFFLSPKGVTKLDMYTNFHKNPSIRTNFGKFYPPPPSLPWGKGQVR